MSGNKREWISAPEAGRMLQKHPQTVKAWVERGYLVGYQPHPGAHHLISLESVERMLAARRCALSRLKHEVADATSDQKGDTKISGDFGREGESGIAVGGEPHKHSVAFWLLQTWPTALTANGCAAR